MQGAIFVNVNQGGRRILRVVHAVLGDALCIRPGHLFGTFPQFEFDAGQTRGIAHIIRCGIGNGVFLLCSRRIHRNRGGGFVFLHNNRVECCRFTHVCSVIGCPDIHIPLGRHLHTENAVLQHAVLPGCRFVRLHGHIVFNFLYTAAIISNGDIVLNKLRVMVFDLQTAFIQSDIRGLAVKGIGNLERTVDLSARRLQIDVCKGIFPFRGGFFHRQHSGRTRIAAQRRISRHFEGGGIAAKPFPAIGTGTGRLRKLNRNALLQFHLIAVGARQVNGRLFLVRRNRRDLAAEGAEGDRIVGDGLLRTVPGKDKLIRLHARNCQRLCRGIGTGIGPADRVIHLRGHTRELAGNCHLEGGGIIRYNGIGAVAYLIQRTLQGQGDGASHNVYRRRQAGDISIPEIVFGLISRGERACPPNFNLFIVTCMAVRYGKIQAFHRQIRNDLAVICLFCKGIGCAVCRHIRRAVIGLVGKGDLLQRYLTRGDFP